MKSFANCSRQCIYLLSFLLLSNSVHCRSYCPHLLERMRMCKRTDHTIQEMETLREKPVELDPNLMQDIESAIKGMEEIVLPSPSLSSSKSSVPRTPVVPSSPPSSSFFLPVDSSIPAPSPYITAPDPSSPSPSPSPSLHYMPSLPGVPETSGRSFMLNGKIRKLINIYSRWIDQNNINNRRASKTARVVGHVAGNLVGMIVNERFRQIGDLFGNLARRGVREITVAGLDNVFKLYKVKHK